VTVSVAVIGTGRMGAAMAERVAEAGHKLTVWNRTREKAEKLGFDVADTAREAVADAEVVIVSLADDAAVREAYVGSDGIVAGLRPGTVVADASTVAPDTVRALASDVSAVGASLVDTPVSGSVPSVRSGTILVMAGGDADAVETARPALESFAQRIILLGPVGSGATMKLAVNAMVFGLNQTLSESLVLAEKAGVPRELAYEVIANSAVAAPFVNYKQAAFLDPDSAPVAFALDLVAKDLDLAADLADQVDAAVPQLETNRWVVGIALAAGRGGEDLSALAEHLRGGG
jgi:3-hydroxyisobutyrate dehydrogenase-like beta-hydroxyacid dehydrogenase